MLNLEIKILIVEDHPIMGNAICSSMAAQIQGAAFDQASNLSQALALLQEAVRMQKPYRMIVTDLHLPDSDGEATLSALRSCCQKSPIVVLTMDESPQIVEACKTLGATYISKSDTSSEFEMAVRAVFLNDADMVEPKSEHNNSVRVKSSPDLQLQQLTRKQNSVLAELAHGYSNKEIAKRMNVSDETVREHVAEIFKRLGVQNRTQATKHYLLSAYAKGQQ